MSTSRHSGQRPSRFFDSRLARRIPPIQCLLTFEALARLRSVTLTAEELSVTPSAVSHRVRQLEQTLGTQLFGRADFSLTTEGQAYLQQVREGLSAPYRCWMWWPKMPTSWCAMAWATTPM